MQGKGTPALILIHGWSCDKSYWAPQLEPLSRDFRLIAPDLAGHGESGSAREIWTIDAFGRDVAAAVDAAGSGPVVLVGHSMGGTVAVAAARHLGDRVQAIVWVDSYRKLGSPRTPGEIEEVLAPFRADFRGATGRYVHGMFPPGADPVLVERVASAMAAAPPAIAVAALQASMTFGRTITEQLETLRPPVLAINAGEPPTDVPSLQRHGVEVAIVPGTGHFPMMEAPERFNALLTRLVSRFRHATG